MTFKEEDDPGGPSSPRLIYPEKPVCLRIDNRVELDLAIADRQDGGGLDRVMLRHRR